MHFGLVKYIIQLLSPQLKLGKDISPRFGCSPGDKFAMDIPLVRD